jgi:hypothetical protein
MQSWVSHYCDGKDFFPKAPLFQMHMVINLFLIMIINNEIWSNNFIIKTSMLLFFETKFIHYE